MNPTQPNAYLESKIMTAPPHRLHLMLIEGAIRLGRQAAAAMAGGDQRAAGATLLRVIDIVGELLAGVRATRSEINDRLAQLYWYLFQRVSEAKINADPGKLAEALELLEYERQTWRLVCEKAAAEAPSAARLRHELGEPHLSALPRPAIKAPPSSLNGGLSLEA
jgi:flagellar protein FliS